MVPTSWVPCFPSVVSRVSVGLYPREMGNQLGVLWTVPSWCRGCPRCPSPAAAVGGLLPWGVWSAYHWAVAVVLCLPLGLCSGLYLEGAQYWAVTLGVWSAYHWAGAVVGVAVVSTSRVPCLAVPLGVVVASTGLVQWSCLPMGRCSGLLPLGLPGFRLLPWGFGLPTTGR